MKRGLRTGLLRLGAALAIAALPWLVPIAEPLQRSAADWMLRVAPAPEAAPRADLPDVSIVAIDAQSLRALPHWPWPRSVHAELVERLDALGARAIGFDVDFSTPRAPASDARFVEAVTRSGRVALATFRQLQPLPGGTEVEVATRPFPALTDAAAALGSVLVHVDPDGVVRRFSRSTSIAGTPTPSLAEATLAIALADEPRLDPGPPVAVDYRRARPAPPLLSVVDVLEDRVDRSLVAGRIVLVGPTALELQDIWTTPLGPARPGVWIQALALRTLAAERAGAPTLREVPRSAQLGLAVALSLLAASLARLGHARRVALLGTLALATPVACLALLGGSGRMLDPVVPLGVLGLHYVTGLESVRRRFRANLAHQEHSLSTLFQLGRATSGQSADSPAGGIDLALALLGDVVGARGVAFLRCTREAVLDGVRIEWAPAAHGPVGDAQTAASVLEEGKLRVFPGRPPGPVPREGLAVYLPLFAGEAPVGVLVVERDAAEELDEMELRTVATAGAQLALSAQNLRLLDDLRLTFDTSIAAMASAIEARDGYTESHCRRLAAFAVAMGQRLGLPESELDAMRLGALLHDVGKIGIRDEVLLKPGRFTPEERAEMEGHAATGHRIVASIHGMQPTTLHCIRHHHERWDGSGYPDRLAGPEIPLGARVVAIVDVWDALSTRRPYKDALPQPKVIELLEKGRGTQFDPDLLELFFVVLEEEGEEMLALIERTTSPTA